MLSGISNQLAPAGRAARFRQIAPIEDESAWRRSTRLASAATGPVIAIGRWSERCDHAHELSAGVLPGHYTIDVLLGDTHIACFRNGRKISDGAVRFGSTQIAAPGQEIRCCFERSREAIHLFMPHEMVVVAHEDLRQNSCPVDFELRDPCFAADPMMGRLARALADAGTLDGPFATLYSEGLSMAVLARLMETQACTRDDAPVRAGLAPWRQRRAIDYMEANLGEAISLQDIAGQAGLSRMHFAAQFRRSTGLTPHAFLLHRRLEKAKQMLHDDALPLIQIALEVGFQSQAHFTTVFRKLTGTTPGRWRARATANGTAVVGASARRAAVALRGLVDL